MPVYTSKELFTESNYLIILGILSSAPKIIKPHKDT